MSEAWQVEAVKEQFKVLHSLENIQKDLNTSDIFVILKEVDTIVKKHLRVKEKCNYQPTRLSMKIKNESNGKVKFGFIVVVSDQRVNGQLSKIPIFVIQCGQGNVFIDISCFSFGSWDSFLLEHCRKLLPPGNFCFPVNGQYLDGKRLKIDFATNLKLSIRKCLWCLAVTGLTTVGFIASFFVNVRPALQPSTDLISIAEKHLDSFNGPLAKQHVELLRHFLDWREGKTSWKKGFPLICRSLINIFHYYGKEMDEITFTIKDKLRNILDFLKNKFPSVFKHQTVPLRLLGHINNNDKCLLGSGDMNGLRQHDLSASKIFENCVNKSAIHYQNGKEKSQYEALDLTPCNKALVCMTSDFIQHTNQQNLSQNELSNNYLILKDLVVDESTERLKLYNKCRVAALNSGSVININEYNQCLGITGDPETHFFNEAINHVNQSPTIRYLVKSKCKELVEQEPVQLIQCSKMPNNDKYGIYKFIGMENGLIAPKKFIKPLKEIFCTEEGNELFDEDKFIEKEVGSSGGATHTALLSENCSVFIQQSITCEGNAEGFLSIIENEW